MLFSLGIAILIRAHNHGAARMVFATRMWYVLQRHSSAYLAINIIISQ